MSEIRFTLDGLHCGSCVGRAEHALTQVEGVRAARVNLADASATVELATDDRAPAVAAALNDAGYPAVPQHISLSIDGMHCASCVARVEAALRNAPGVLSSHVNLLEGKAGVETLGRVTDLENAITDLGFAVSVSGTAAPTDRHALEAKEQFRNFLIAGALTLPVFILEMGGHLIPAFHHWIMQTIGLPTSWTIQFVLTTFVLIWPGRGFFTAGLPALRRMAPDMNALVVLGTGAAWAFSTVALFAPDILPIGSRAVYFEAAAVIITLILLGRWLEARAKSQTGTAIKALIGLQPRSARVLRDGVQQDIPIAQVVAGDVLMIRPGEKVPTDAVVQSGTSFIDESMVTGEPVAVEKGAGDMLVGGTINGNGALTIEATAVGADTVLARIVALVQDAQGARLPVQDLVNTVTRWFVPAVMGVATMTVLGWLLFGPAPALSYALVAGVSVLIVACPCAMGLATPTAIMVGTGRAATLGVLFRRGDALQALQGVQVVAFDKTGTLTLGKPVVTEVTGLHGDPEAMLRAAAAVEAQSEHPLAQAIVSAVEGTLPTVTDFEAILGHGLRGHVEGQDVLVGAVRLMTREGIDTAAFDAPVQGLAEKGQTPVLVAIDGVAAGVIGLADEVRPDAGPVVKSLQEQGLRVVMITGDTAAAGETVGAALGITEVIAGVVPEGKVDAVRNLQAGGAKVVFVGDGINDAPALATADVGVAIGTGTDVAVESADVVLMSGDPHGVVNAITMSRATMRNIKQNLGWAFGYNIALIPVAAAGMLSPALAAGAMALSSVLVVSNALRLRKIKGAA